MKIKLLLRDVLQSESALNVLTQKGMTDKVGYRLGKIHWKILREIQDYENERAKVLKSHGAKLESVDGRETLRVDPDSPKYDDCQAALDRLFEEVIDEEVVLDGVATVTLDEFMAALPEQSQPKTDDEEEDNKPLVKRVPPFIMTTLWWWIIDEKEDKNAGSSVQHKTVIQKRREAEEAK